MATAYELGIMSKKLNKYTWKSLEDLNLFRDCKRKRCCMCGRLAFKWQKINGGPAHCYDGCYNTTGLVQHA